MSRTPPTLADRLAALDRARELGQGLIPPGRLGDAAALSERAATRRRLAPDHTTVGLFGATGSGKSSVFNALVGAEVSRPGVIRPTTSSPTAAVWQAEGTSPLLDWLQIPESWVSDEAAAPPLVLLDLPDFDSVATENRRVVDRLAGQVDVLIWVVDPQKYADQVIHRDYLRPLAHQRSVTLVVLNQVDLLAPGDLNRVVASLRQLLDADGLDQAPIFPVSALTGSGIGELRRAVRKIAADKTAADLRLSADVAAWARGQEPPEGGGAGKAAQSHLPELQRRVGQASRIDTVADAVGAAYRKRSGQATGWVLTSWISRLRPDPLRRLRVEGGGAGKAADGSRADAVGLRHTSLPPMSGRERALLSTGVREYADAVAATLPEDWRGAVQGVGRESLDALPGAIDREIGSVEYRVRRSWWWSIATILQWLALLTALVGIGWYLATWITAALALPIVPIAKVQGWPVPGLLVVFGLLLGILLGLLFALIGRVVAAGKARRARALLRAGVDRAVAGTVVDPITHVAQRADELARALREAAR